MSKNARKSQIKLLVLRFLEIAILQYQCRRDEHIIFYFYLIIITVIIILMILYIIM